MLRLNSEVHIWQFNLFVPRSSLGTLAYMFALAFNENNTFGGHVYGLGTWTYLISWLVVIYLFTLNTHLNT